MIGRRRPPDVRALVDEHLGAGRPTGWFEPVYAAARRRPDLVPWGGADPHPYVVDWLADPVVSPPGRRAVVVGCGLGGDAGAVADAGYEVTAFDVAPSAVELAQAAVPAAVEVRVADLLALPDDLAGAFDLVIEVRTVQSLPGVVRDAAMHAVASLARPGAVVVVVTLLATSAQAAADAEGPPWPQAPSELAAYVAGGLRRVSMEHPEVRDGEPAIDVRLTFVRDDGAGPTAPAGGEDVLGIHG